ncbi:hypothetical protein SmJEL517_g00145 [Synchytrium microbalum]|uniref:Large ribosomal subunit protein bL27m n=1 Tax=Synchytrium microbalum TaxID=1806994 RepID=A0A507CFL2_9FUNG|nr:uncharacterized protein SmJEL517_g00145 [Synchytrium microbalum]TPX38148.1 hypothetical protein SmJEL517_g00145 [Synchytrium microbalum]
MFASISSASLRSRCSTSLQPLSINPSSSYILQQVRTATKKSSGGSANGRDSQPKHLGIKRGDGAIVQPCDILVRQRGNQFHAGINVTTSKDYTLHALVAGRVKIHYDLARRRRIVSIDDGSNSLSVVMRTQQEAKQMLADAINVPKYMSMDAASKYRYVLDKVEEIKKQDEATVKANAVQHLLNRTRKMDLVDLTLL